MYFNRSSKRSRRSWRSRPCCSVDWLEKRPAPNRNRSSETLWLLCRGNSQVQQSPADSRQWSNPSKVSRRQAFSLETLAPDSGTGRVNRADVSTLFCVTKDFSTTKAWLYSYSLKIYIYSRFFFIKNRNLNLQRPAQTLHEKRPNSK